MGPGEVIVALFGILWLSGALKELAKRWSGPGKKEQAALAAEVRALREEVGQLRQQHADAVLSFDSTLDHLERRLTHVETHALPPGDQPSREEEPSGQLAGSK